MSLVAPLALFLLLPLVLAWVLAGSARIGRAGGLPGTWAHVVSASLQTHVARRSGLSQAGASVLCLVLGIVLILALARPGLNKDQTEDYANVAGRVVVFDVGADTDFARHRLFFDALHSAGPVVATSVVAVAGDAYRIVPFTTDKAQIDRYLRVLDAGMMPAPGQRPHLGLAMAERMLDEAGFLARQIVVVSAEAPPSRPVDLPRTETRREIVALGDTAAWKPWADGWGARLGGQEQATEIALDLQDAAKSAINAELPVARFDLTGWLLALSAVLWLLLFRRRAA